MVVDPLAIDNGTRASQFKFFLDRASSTRDTKTFWIDAWQRTTAPHPPKFDNAYMCMYI